MTGLELVRSKGIWIVVASLFFYVALILFSDVEAISKNLFKLKFEFFALVLLIEFGSIFVRSLRQKKFLEYVDMHLSVKESLKIYLAGLSLVVTPGGAGEFIKTHYLKRNYDKPVSQTFPIVFLERYHDLLATTSILVFTLFIVFSVPTIVLVSISFFLLIIIFFIVRVHKPFLKLREKLLNIRFFSKMIPDKELGKSFTFLTSPKAMAKGWSMSIGGWALDALAVYFVFLALDTGLGFIDSTQMYFTSLGYGILSFLPGGIGVTESSFVGLLAVKGFEFSVASSVVILIRLATIWFATILGVVSTRYVLKQKA